MIYDSLAIGGIFLGLFYIHNGGKGLGIALLMASVIVGIYA